MFSRNKIFALGLVGTLSLFSLSSCSASAPEAEITSATPAADVSQPATTDLADLENMSGLVADAKTLVELDDWHTVKILNGQIEDEWKYIEDGIKDTNKTDYETVKTHLDGLNTALKESNPDKTTVLGHLDELKTALAGVSL